MPVKSYIVIPNPGRLVALHDELSSIPECETSVADNKDVIVLLTDTVDEAADKMLFAHLLQLPDVQHINLVAAFST